MTTIKKMKDITLFKSKNLKAKPNVNVIIIKANKIKYINSIRKDDENENNKDNEGHYTIKECRGSKSTNNESSRGAFYEHLR